MLEFLIGSDIIYGRIMNGSILFTKENMGKEFIVNSHPYKSFAEKGMLDEYEKYLGYSMKCIDWFYKVAFKATLFFLKLYFFCLYL